MTYLLLQEHLLCVPPLLLNPCVWQGAGTGGDGNTLSEPCRGGQRLDRVAAGWGDQLLFWVLWELKPLRPSVT